MLVSNLDVMEQIVARRPDLEWNGWDVVYYKKNPSAQFDKSGTLKDGTWYKRIVYPVTETGWSIPNFMGLRDDL